MRAIVADVGGTNTRMALADAGRVVAGSARWFRNDDFATFQDVLAAFGGQAEALCVAIAGPVMPGKAALTNRDWCFEAGALSRTLGGAQVHLLNDLAAVGHALPHLRPEALQSVVAGAAQPDGQALVVGIGTGFNVSVAQGNTVFMAEIGHAALPAPVLEILAPVVPVDRFPTTESLFAGPGLVRLHHALGGAVLTGHEIVEGHPETVAIYLRALAAICVEMTYLYLPLGGIYLNGGLGRAVASLEGLRHALTAQRPRDVFGGRLAEIPVWAVTDDTAALAGCAAVLAMD